MLTLLALPHELAELGKVEPSVLIGVGCVALHRVLPEAGLEVLLARPREVVGLRRRQVGERVVRHAAIMWGTLERC